MGTVTNMTKADSGDYPLAHTKAARMMSEALDRANKDKGLSQRDLAKTLGYKTSVVLSHMALGRVPIPIDRTMDYARLLDMPKAEFLIAALEQRHPDINFMRILVGAKKNLAQDDSNDDTYMLDELEALAGDKLKNLSVDRLNVIREAAADPKADRRWMSIPEMSLVEIIRRERPDISKRGLHPEKAKKLREFLQDL